MKDSFLERLFQQVQDVINGYHKTPHKSLKPFIFKGLITCADCGCVVTPEIHKKRYIYYSCTNAQKSVQTDLCKRRTFDSNPCRDTLIKIALSQKQIEAVTKYLKEIHESESHFHAESLASLQREQDKIQKRIRTNL